MELLALLVLALIGPKDVPTRHWPNIAPATLKQPLSSARSSDPFIGIRCVLSMSPVKFERCSSMGREFTVDRTSWKLGKTDVNALFLAVNWRGVAVPLLFELLPLYGYNGTRTRLALLNDALKLLKCHEAATIYADSVIWGNRQGLARSGRW